MAPSQGGCLYEALLPGLPRECIHLPTESSAGCCHKFDNVGMRLSPDKIGEKEHNVASHSFATSMEYELNLVFTKRFLTHSTIKLEESNINHSKCLQGRVYLMLDVFVL